MRVTKEKPDLSLTAAIYQYKNDAVQKVLDKYPHLVSARAGST